MKKIIGKPVETNQKLIELIERLSRLNMITLITESDETFSRRINAKIIKIERGRVL